MKFLTQKEFGKAPDYENMIGYIRSYFDPYGKLWVNWFDSGRRDLLGTYREDINKILKQFDISFPTLQSIVNYCSLQTDKESYGSCWRYFSEGNLDIEIKFCPHVGDYNLYVKFYLKE